MSLNLTTVRLDIAAVLATIPDYQAVHAYEHRDIELGLLPLVMVFRDQVEGPGPDAPQPALGMFGYTITWRIRSWLAMDSDQAAQDQADVLTVKLREAFDTRPALISNTVMRAALVTVEPVPIIEGVSTPVLMLEGTLITEVDA
jgi:hypothetical protein